MDLEMYDFGNKQVSPKETLATPFEAIDKYTSMQRRIKEMAANYGEIRGRSDHFIRDLDILRHICQEIMYDAMVIRESITGNKTREEADAKARNKNPHS